MTQTAAIAACAVLLALALFQGALIVGTPWGRFAWGGGHVVLPTGFRVASGVSILIYGLIAAVLLMRAGLLAPVASAGVLRMAAWGLAGYFALGVVMNGVSRSRPEQLTMTPVALALCLLSGIVAFGR